MNEPTPFNSNAPLTPADPTASSTSASVSDTARAAWDSTRQTAGEALQSGENYVRENPRASALGVFGVGFAVGLLVGWALAHERHDSYPALGKRWAHKLHLD